MQELQRGRFNEMLRDFLGIRNAAPAPELGTQILPTLNANDLADLSLYYLRSERLCAGTTNLGAPGAGNYNYIGLLNPSTSGMLAIVDLFSFLSSLATDAYLYHVPGGIGPGTPSNLRRVLDGRWTNVATVCTVNGAQPAINPTGNLVGVHWVSPVPAATIVTVPLRGWVLHPGWSLWVALTLVATPTLYANFGWRERVQGLEEAPRL